MAGADKIVTYDPPGAIGLVDPAPLILLRFNEDTESRAPQDDAGHLEDLHVGVSSLIVPHLVSAVLGRGRAFDLGYGYVANDRVPGTTIATRDVSVQAVVSFDLAIGAHEPRGVIVARGEDSGVAGEGVSYALAVGIDNAPTNSWRMNWLWSTLDGVLHIEPGPAFIAPPAGRFTMLTATRRWLSPTQVILRYYIGDLLLGEYTVADGAIAGALSQRTNIGCAYDRTAASHVNNYAGVIDEILVVGREICAEEVEATWLRLTVYQPLGVQLFREQFDPGFPITSDRGSDAQREIALMGQALGFAAAGIENLRANFLPQRAYGSTLTQWEQAVAAAPSPVLTIGQRRDRVIARLRQKNGISIDGIRQALADLVDTDPTNLEFLAYDNTVVDTFATQVNAVLWDATPVGAAVWNAGRARFTLTAGDYRLDATGHTWRTLTRPISQAVGVAASGHHVIGSVQHSTAAANTEAGVWFGDGAIGNYFVVGVRFSGGSYAVVAERFVNHASVGLGLDPASLSATNPGKIWLHAWHDEAAGKLQFAWSPDGVTYNVFAGVVAGFAQAAAPGDTMAGYYVRSLVGATMTTTSVVDCDDFTLWTPHGIRPLNAYVYRNPALGGAPDPAGAQSVLQAIRHAYTHVSFITSKALICDSTTGGCDRGPMGAP